MTDLINSLLQGIIEGLTEFVPVSSTGHLLLFQHVTGTPESDFWKMFAIFIQIGAIAAVVVYFRHRLLGLLRGVPYIEPPPTDEIDARLAGPGAAIRVPTAPVRTFSTRADALVPLILIAVGTMPVLLVGYLTHKWVEKNLEGPIPIAVALLIGGVIMLLAEFSTRRVTTRRFEEMSISQAAAIGLVQVLAAVFPGTSRSAATIVGGMFCGLSRAAAAEYSFFLAIPAMGAATAYSLFVKMRNGNPMSGEQWLLLSVGTLVSFLVAWVVIAGFMNYVRRHSFTPFALYRMALGVLVLIIVR